MTWNIRLFKEKTDDGDLFTLRETYYSNDHIVGYTESPIAVGESISELLDYIAKMLAGMVKEPITLPLQEEKMMIELIGPWDDHPEDKDALLKGVTDLSKTLGEITGLPGEEAFERVVGPIKAILKEDVSGPWHAIVVNGIPDEVQFQIGYVTPELAVHEIGGHIINDKVPNSERPATRLGKKAIVTESRKFVTGPGANGYSRHGGMYAPKNGYKTDGMPFQQHSATEDGGNSSIEDWADQVTSRVYDNLSDDDKGRAIKKYVDDEIKSRL